MTDGTNPTPSFPDIVADPSTISPAWFDGLLEAAEIEAPPITGLGSKRIGTGQVGQCVRFDLEYGSGSTEAPRSMVGKFASPDEESRAAGVAQQCYLKEVGFFLELAHLVTIRTPDCYFAAIDGEGPDFTLMLEDMAPAEQGDQIAGCSPEVATAALRELAGLHAPLWGDAALAEIPWLATHGADRLAVTSDLYDTVLPGFIERYQHRLTREAVDICYAIGESNKTFRAEGYRLPKTVVHSDYRLDNLLIGESPNEVEVCVVDWQTVNHGQGAADVAYFIGASMSAEARRPIENDLLLAYADGLREVGIRFETEDFIEDYRLSTFGGVTMAVIASMIVGRTERGDDMFMAMARGHAQHALDWKATELL